MSTVRAQSYGERSVRLKVLENEQSTSGSRHTTRRLVQVCQVESTISPLPPTGLLLPLTEPARNSNNRLLMEKPRTSYIVLMETANSISNKQMIKESTENCGQGLKRWWSLTPPSSILTGLVSSRESS